MTTIEKLLKSSGPLLSSELAKRVAEGNKIKRNTASQQVARAKDILRINGFFKSQQSLMFLEEHVDDDLVYPVLAKKMFEHGLKYWYTLNALRLHEGTVGRQFLECYTNYPILPLKSHLPFFKVMQKFINENVIAYNGDDYLLSPKIYKTPSASLFSKTIENIKLFVLEDFHSLVRNTGIISYDSGAILEEHGKFRWGFKGLSPIVGLKTDGKFGFVLADILIGVPIYKEDVMFFIAKLKQILSFKSASRVIPFLIVDDLDKEAMMLVKENGIVVGFVRELFGAKYAETMKELISIFNNAGASLKTNPNKYLELIDELKKFNKGLLNNIRGTLFEYVVGHIHVSKGSNIEIGWEIVENGGRHEMDVQAIYGDKVVISECKGTKSQIELEDVEKWITKKIPAFKKWFLGQEIFKKKELKFEYWSTAGFTDDALQRMKDFKSSYTKHEINFFTPDEIRKVAKEMNNKKLKEALENFFLKTKV